MKGRSLLKKPFRVLIRILSDVINMFIVYMPGAAGQRIRYLYYKKRLKHLGQNVTIDQGVFISSPQFVSIGDNTWIDKYVILLAGPIGLENTVIIPKKNPKYRNNPGELVIGQNCHIAPFCLIQAHGGVSIGNDCGLTAGTQIYSFSQHYYNPRDRCNRKIYFTPMAKGENRYDIVSPVVIEDNVGVGLNSIVLYGAIIEKDSFILPFSLVRSRIPENSVAGGRPAKRIQERFKSIEARPSLAE